MRSIEQDRAWQRVVHEYHHAVVHVPGVVKRDKDGKAIRTMGVKEAAKIAGLSTSDMSNRLNPNMVEHRPTLEGFVMHLLNGMDKTALDAIESELGRVAINVPDFHDHGNLQGELMACIKEFGDVGSALQNAMADDSHKGRIISHREFAIIKKEVEEAVSELYALLAAVEEGVK